MKIAQKLPFFGATQSFQKIAKSSPIGEKLPNLVTLVRLKLSLL
jgi:hypothetical protein